MKVWAFQYNDCYHESAFATMSLHKSKGGAERAMEKHRRGTPNQQDWQLWRVEAVKIED